MSKLFYILLSFVLVFVFVACTGEKAQEKTEMDTEATVEKVMDENMAACAADCGMTMEKEKMIAVEEDGETKYFCSEKCKEAYMAKEAVEDEEGEETDTKDES